MADDDPGTLRLVSALLEKIGYEPITVSSGEEALSILLRPGAPQIALLDWMMPDLSGIEVAKELRKRLTLRPVHVIMMTSRGDPQDIVTAMLAGASDYLVKPVEIDLLRARLWVGVRRLETMGRLDQERARNLRNSSLVSLGVMAGGVAHEINRPLELMAEYARRAREILGQGGRPDPTELRELLENTREVEAQIHRVEKVVRVLALFAREGGIDRFEERDLREVTEKAIDGCRARIESQGIQLTLEGFDRPMPVECQTVPLGQALLNLLNNACDAVMRGGQKWVRVEIRDRLDTVEVVVADGGPGVDEADRDQIFDPFFTTKPEGHDPRRGLSLSVANGIVEGHQGSLQLVRTGAPTEFMLTIPKRQRVAASDLAA